LLFVSAKRVADSDKEYLFQEEPKTNTSVMAVMYMHIRIVQIVIFLITIILGLLVGTGLKRTEVGRLNQSMTDPNPKPPIDL